MKKSNILLQVLILITIIAFQSCDNYMDVNENPNAPTQVPPELLIKGMELANTHIQSGHWMRTSQLWNGQLIGVTNVYQGLYQFNISPEDTNGAWSLLYHDIISQNVVIQENSEDNLIKGIANVIEANAVGAMASLFGDIPYSEAGLPDPVFDSQMDVFSSVQNLLDTAISQLQGEPSSRETSEDILLNGNPTAWIEVAYSLKARYYLIMNNYSEAYENALSGISSPDHSLMFAAGFGGYGTTGDNSNLYNNLLNTSRSGDITSEGSFIQDLLDVTNATSRNNAKTDETRRKSYLTVTDDTKDDSNITAADALLPLITYEENLLILAETALRIVSFDEGLEYLNTLRSYLASGEAFTGDPGLPVLYETYNAADFAAGGMENPEGISNNEALLREIIEEKYVTTFGNLTPFDDFRRIRSTDSVIAMDIPVNSSSEYPERFPIAQDEINGNLNTPTPIPDIFTKTPVNN